MQPPGAGGLGARAAALRAAKAGIGQGLAAHGSVASGGVPAGDVFACAGAGVGQARAFQLRERAGVERAPAGLPCRFFIRQQLAGGQLAQDGLPCAGNAARRVHIFNAHQPAALVRARVQPAGQGRHQRACMQQAGGRGGEAACVGACLQSQFNRLITRGAGAWAMKAAGPVRGVAVREP